MSASEVDLITDGNLRREFFRLRSLDITDEVILFVFWHHYNAKFFGGKLVVPNFELYYEPDERHGAWVWKDNRRLLKLNVTEFEGYEPFRHTLLHEMCHQAVRELDRMLDPDIVHGPDWNRWAALCGVEPYTDDD